MNVTVSARWRITLSRERPCQTGALHITNSTETTTGSGIFCAMASRMENSFTRQARAPAMHGYAFKMASPHWAAHAQARTNDSLVLKALYGHGNARGKDSLVWSVLRGDWRGSESTRSEEHTSELQSLMRN